MRLCLVLMMYSTSLALAENFALRDGDTVVFLGDSITAGRGYGKLIEEYTLLRYPARQVRFVNAGWGGDTAAGGLARLDRDVFSRGATLLTVAYGINDIGWGAKADPEHRQKYLDSIRGIVQACKARGVRVYICSAAITAGDKGEDDYLQKMCDDGMAISRSLGEKSIDVQRAMRIVLQRVRQWNKDHKDSHETLHAPDGIHLNDLGQLAMGFAILKGLGAPAEVSSVTLSAKGPRLIEARGCRVSDVVAGAETRTGSAAATRRDGQAPTPGLALTMPASPAMGVGLSFTRLDEGLPLNLEPLWQLHFRFIPFPDELNRYMLTIRDLPAGEYEVLACDRRLGKWNARQLAEGVNLSSATPDPWQPGGPWDAQAHLLKRLTEARHDVLLDAIWAPDFLKKTSKAEPVMTDLDQLDASIQKAQRDIARPIPYSFMIQPERLSASQPSH